MAIFNTDTKEICFLDQKESLCLKHFNSLSEKTTYHSYYGKGKVPVIIHKGNVSNKILVMLHGGPQSHYGFSYDIITDLLIKQNWLIYKVNYYGSTSYGKEYMNSLKGNAGIIDLNQVVNLIKELNRKFPDKDIYIYI